MKRWTRLIIVVFILVLCGFGVFVIQKKLQSPSVTKQAQTEVAIPRVTVSIFNGVKPQTYLNIQAKTAFEALTKIVNQEQLSLQTKQYDFGIFIEGVGGIENTKDKTWIYFVNGKSGEVASDKYDLKENDTVEWKYTTPIY